MNLAIAARRHDVLVALRQERERVPLQVGLRQHGEEPGITVHAEERAAPVVVAAAELTRASGGPEFTGAGMKTKISGEADLAVALPGGRQVLLLQPEVHVHPIVESEARG